MSLNVQIGNSYKVRHPHGEIISYPERIHVENIFPNRNMTEEKANIVVYRVWQKRKMWWEYYAEPYYRLALLNGWPHTDDNIVN